MKRTASEIRRPVARCLALLARLAVGAGVAPALVITSGATSIPDASTVVSITAMPEQVAPGGAVSWTITETNDGLVPLTNARVDLSLDGGVSVFMVLAAPPASGDTNGDEILDPGETWEWMVPTNPQSTVTLTATGHGFDPMGNDITYPDDPDERDEATVEVVRFGNGSPCTMSQECTSGFCVDGVCCNSACDGPDQQCNAPGIEGQCAARSAPAPAPSTSPLGLVLGIGLLIVVARFAMRGTRML